MMAHSTKNLSNDLRERVVKARLSGMRVKDIVQQFSVSPSSIQRWVQRYRETGSVDAKKRGGAKSSKITDMAKFESFAKAYAYCTLRQMQAKWEDEVSEMCLSRALKRLGWTRKKSRPTTANATKQNAQPS